MHVLVILLLIPVAFVAGILVYLRLTNGDLVQPSENLKVTSPAFANGGSMPTRYSGRGDDLSPPLDLHEIDSNARSISVVMDDHDHPAGIFNHWVLWNIPAGYTRIPEGIPHAEIVPLLGEAVQGRSAYGGTHYYRGPLPPFGTHTYVFKVYVLDTTLDLPPSARKPDLQRAMDGHIIQFGTLTGTFGGRR
jgi:Raf kinase inhibitor-like YbhB/YbcL family protein